MSRELLIRQRVFSWTDTYDVYDGYETPKYYVEAEFLALGHRLHVYEKIREKEVGSVKQKLLTFMPRFDIEIDGEEVGMISREISLFTPKYEVDYNGWKVEGDFLGWDYRVMDGSKQVMSISKEIFHWGDTYVIRYEDDTDELMGLMLVLAIDAANCSNAVP